MISGQIEVRSPYNGSVIGTVTAATASDVDRARSTAYALLQNRRGWLPKQHRIAVLQRAAEIVAERRDTIARLAAQAFAVFPFWSSETSQNGITE